MVTFTRSDAGEIQDGIMGGCCKNCKGRRRRGIVRDAREAITRVAGEGAVRDAGTAITRVAGEGAVRDE